SSSKKTGERRTLSSFCRKNTATKMSSRYHGVSRSGKTAGHVLRSQKLRSQLHLGGPNNLLNTSGENFALVGSPKSPASHKSSLLSGPFSDPSDHQNFSNLNVRVQTAVAYPKQFGHNDLKQIFGVRYNPNFHRGENYVAVGYADGALRVFETDSWSKVACSPVDFDTPDPEESKLLAKGIQIPPSQIHGAFDAFEPITSLKWMDSRRVLFLQGNQINILNGVGNNGANEDQSNQPKVERVDHKHGAMYVCDVAGNPNDLGACKRPQRFLVGGTERKVVIYDAKTLQETCCLRKSLYRADSFAHSNRISSAKFFPDCDGQIYVTGSWDNSVAVWDCRSGKRERFLDEQLVLVGSGPEALDVDRNSILTGSYRTKDPVQLFDFGTCKLLETCPTSSSAPSLLGAGGPAAGPATSNQLLPYSCQFSRDSKKILIGGKHVNAEKQGSFVVLRRVGGGRSMVQYEDHSRQAAVWSVDAVTQNSHGVLSTEYALGHADGVLQVLQS
ncbi:unnamed protein product, partial [Amoebophrya sp. A120]